MEFLTFARCHLDRVLGWAAVALGAIVLVVGWVGVSSTGYVFEQLPYVISGGVGGLFLLGLGAMSWLSADLRDEWSKLDSLEQAVLAGNALLAQQQELAATVPLQAVPTPSRRAAASRSPR